MEDVDCDCGCAEGLYIYHALSCKVMQPKKPFKDCNYCCEPKECAIKGCYNAIMNVHGKEMCFSNAGLIIPLRDKKWLEYRTELYKKLDENYKEKFLGKEFTYTYYDEIDKVKYKDPFTITKEYYEDKKKMNIYSFPLTRCSRTIWNDSNGKPHKIIFMPLPYVKNVYLKLINSAWQHVATQDSISRITELNYPGRYNLDRMDRAKAFLREMCPSWDSIVARCTGIVCRPDGTPYPIYHPAYKEMSNADSGKSEPIARDGYTMVAGDKLKLTNGKVMTDTAGNQFLLFPIE